VRSRFCLFAAIFTLLLGSGTALATGDGPGEPAVSEFGAGLSDGVGLWGIANGPDGNLWFSEESLGGVGRITPAAVITEFTAGFPTGLPRGIASGPDGNLWVAMAGGNGAIAKVTKSGEVTEYPVTTPGDPTEIAVGPDNNLWYTDPASNLVGRITLNGSVTEFPVTTDASAPTGIAKGPDGALWFTEAGAGQIGRITTSGVITEFSSGISGGSSPQDIATGSDGNLWFTEKADPGAIGRITPKGDVTEFTDGLTAGAGPQGIAAGPDGNLWFTESTAAAIGRITPGGDITEYKSGFADILNPFAIAAGPDGNMWFTGSNIPGLIGRITLPPLLRDLTADTITTTSARLRGKVRPNSQSTEYRFEYGRTADYGHETPAAYAGSGYELKTVTATIDGLDPGTEYHYRLVADNDAGESRGIDRAFETEALPAETSTDPVEETPVVPDFGETVVAEPKGDVLVKAPGGGWDVLAPGAEMPLAATFDARHGAVSLTSAGCRGGTQTGHFGGGVFTLRQPRTACGRVDVYLRGGRFRSCPRVGTRRAGSGAAASAARGRKVRKLWGRDSGGSYRTHGRHSQATVRGTRWLTVDRCDGTLTRVTSGAVAVRDLRRHRTVVVHAGHSYLARAHPLPRRTHRKATRRQR
jgi:streptogramin lyase